ncbi:MAG TPA: helix-turn-helix transcriptional regulator [Solirubrobacteraceae bacterium]|jgi:DNA-binding CsgD family transcriptional regulator
MNDLERLRCDVVRAASRAADVEDVFRETDRRLRRHVGYAFAAWHTTDPSSLLATSCVVVGRDKNPADERFVHENEWHDDDVNKYADLASGDVPVATLHAATGGHPERSRRHRELLQPLGMGDELRAGLLDGDSCWGTVTLYRQAAAGPFPAAEITAVRAIAPLLGEAVRLTVLRRATEEPHEVPDGPGVLLLDADGEIVSATGPAERHLGDLADPSQARSAVRALHARTSAAAAGRADALVRSRLRARDGGWLVLHGSSNPLGGNVIVIERARPAELADVIVAAYGFTPREREVLAYVLRGLPSKQIARALGISLYTVQDHLKAAFAKAGVTSRGELAALLTDEHYRPMRRTGSPPGPYGWFLPADGGGTSR